MRRPALESLRSTNMKFEGVTAAVIDEENHFQFH
ncbi:predicted protein [Botrytis cinerea T4]|uniref:Uncharacterized protein n=1 Tax=Botryotinia fuckeliana (strain T4) TaxID=999810 RepID=G2Y7T7_BOTF4|nr:predicted protein [Botrytis cinerea T4]